MELSQLQKNSSQKPLTLSRAAWLLALFPHEKCWNDPNEYCYLKEAVEDSGIREYKLERTQKFQKKITDPRFSSGNEVVLDVAKRPICIYSDYAVASDPSLYSEDFQFVSLPEEADFLLITAHVSDFLAISPAFRLSQFPYESGFVRKDLLILTVRRHCFTGPDGLTPPSWWLPCFDLSTEFHLFAQFYRQSFEDGRIGSWIVKPSQGTRGKGHRVIPAPDKDSSEVKDISCYFERGLAAVAGSAPQYRIDPRTEGLQEEIKNGQTPSEEESDGNEHYALDGDKVAQLLVEYPLLVKGRKFDLRLFVLVRAFEPFEAYLHQLFYARLANKPYDVGNLRDQEVSLTVSAYRSNQAVSARQERLLADELQQQLMLEDPQLDFRKHVQEKCYRLLCELFGGVARSVGHWPCSSAYYSVDVILDDQERCSKKSAAVGEEEDIGPSPKLIEVNYMGDWLGVKAVAPPELYQQWAQDLLEVLATNRDVSGNPRLRQLVFDGAS